MPNKTQNLSQNSTALQSASHPSKPAKKSKRVLIIVIPALLGFLLLFFLLNRTAVIDTFKAIGYNPTPDMLEVKNSLELTGDGERIWSATHPILASRDDFNVSCESHDEAVSVLGCYTNDRIFVYNVEDDSLPGIRESTSAHELLHAVWKRLTGLEKSELVPELESAYANHPEMKETIETYPLEERIGELYVRFATQVKDLPEKLETHYAKFFKDQDKLVSYYDSYIAPFNELTEKINKLKDELSALEKEITERSEALDARVASFDSSVDEFNNCADTAGCFSSQWEFNSRRAELVIEQQSLNQENTAINNLIDSYNKKAEAYNQSIARSSDLQNIINSNAPTTKIEE